MERNRKKRNKEKSLKEWVPKRSYRSASRQGRDEDALTLSDELDVDVAGEFPRLKLGDENVQAREEEEIVASELETFGGCAFGHMGLPSMRGPAEGGMRELKRARFRSLRRHYPGNPDDRVCANIQEPGDHHAGFAWNRA